jgi:hypothetical protein
MMELKHMVYDYDDDNDDKILQMQTHNTISYFFLSYCECWWKISSKFKGEKELDL